MRFCLRCASELKESSLLIVFDGANGSELRLKFSFFGYYVSRIVNLVCSKCQFRMFMSELLFPNY